MHQIPRPTSRVPPSEQRERPPARTPSNIDLTTYTERAGTEMDGGRPSIGRERAGSSANLEKEQTKLNQIIQNFHTKAALTVCASRANLPQSYTKTGEVRQNRWFNLVLDDTDALLDDLQEWKRPDLNENRPVPLVIEVYVDTSSLTPNQALVIADPDGKRWDIADAVPAESRRSVNGSDIREVLLERWSIHLGDAEGYTVAQLNDQLPNVYKKGVVMFRSLFSYARLLPAWKLHRRLCRQTGGGSSMLRLKFRIKRGPQGRASSRLTKESPFVPLCQADVETSAPTVAHNFEPLLCPAGPLSVSVQYRVNCDLSVADSEALLSSRFAGLDAGLQDRSAYGRSLPGDKSQSEAASSVSVRGETVQAARLAGGGAYGSLGTFHAAGRRGSPITVLQQRALSRDEDEDTAVAAAAVRRQSYIGESDLLKNPPFKAGSFASSPKVPPSPSSSLSKQSPFGSSVPKRLSINALPQQSLRTPSYASGEQAIASSGSASPKPAPVHRYSSSFANRKRFMSQGSKVGESATSSGRESTSSKGRSEQLADGNDGSSGSGRTDEDDIAAFIGAVERARELPSLMARKPAGSNTVNLGKYKGMGITSSELADEMSSSSLLQTSLTPPSRRLSNVPGLSTSSSPGRVLTHAPHVRSRLSTHSIAKDIPEGTSSAQAVDEGNDSDDEPFIFQQDNQDDIL